LPAPRLLAQQREPAFEAYALTGAYLHANLSAAIEWKPQLGGGILAPLGAHWAALCDVSTSAVEAYWKADGLPGAAPEDNFTRERRVILLPSIARLWRRDRFSIYAGGGPGFEHERQHSRFRPIIGRSEQGQAVLADHFETTGSTRTDTMLALRAGALVSLSPKIVVRVDFSLLPRYVDETASKSLQAGIGYRF
jgi:hypothetical protein